jgi:hypothetical protein
MSINAYIAIMEKMLKGSYVTYKRDETGPKRFVIYNLPSSEQSYDIDTVTWYSQVGETSPRERQTMVRKVILFQSGISTSKDKLKIENFLQRRGELIESVDMRRLHNVVSINSSFINLANLRNITLDGMISLESIGNDFCKGGLSSNDAHLTRGHCIYPTRYGRPRIIELHSRIFKIGLRGLRRLKKIGDDFISENYIQDIYFGDLSGLTHIGKNFLAVSPCIEKIDMSSLQSLEYIGQSAFFMCPNLYDVKLSGMPRLRTIESGFLNYCPNILYLDISGLSELTNIDGIIFVHTKSLIKLNMSNMTKLVSLPMLFMTNHPNIKYIDMSGLSSLLAIEDGCLSDLANLEFIDISNASKLEYIGNRILADAPRLESVSLGNLESISEIGTNFLEKSKGFVYYNSVQPGGERLGNMLSHRKLQSTLVDLNKFAG